MSKHALVPDRARRGLRTAVVVAVAVITVILGLVPLVLDAVEPLQAHFSGAWYPWLVGVAASILAVAGAAARAGALSCRRPSISGDVRIFCAAPVDAHGVASIASLSDHDRLYVAQLHDALDEGDPARDALARVLDR